MDRNRSRAPLILTALLYFFCHRPAILRRGEHGYMAMTPSRVNKRKNDIGKDERSIELLQALNNLLLVLVDRKKAVNRLATRSREE